MKVVRTFTTITASVQRIYMLNTVLFTYMAWLWFLAGGVSKFYSKSDTTKGQELTPKQPRIYSEPYLTKYKQNAYCLQADVTEIISRYSIEDESQDQATKSCRTLKRMCFSISVSALVSHLIWHEILAFKYKSLQDIFIQADMVRFGEDEVVILQRLRQPETFHVI